MASSGLLALLRSGHAAARGLTQLGLSMVPSFSANNPELATLYDHSEQLVKLVRYITSDGKFKVTHDDAPKTHRVSVDARGKRLTDVLPTGVLLPLAYVIGYRMVKSEGRDSKRGR